MNYAALTFMAVIVTIAAAQKVPVPDTIVPEVEMLKEPFTAFTSRRRQEFKWQTCEHDDFTACSSGTSNEDQSFFKMSGCNRRRTTRQSKRTYVEMTGRRRRYCVMPAGESLRVNKYLRPGGTDAPTTAPPTMKVPKLDWHDFTSAPTTAPTSAPTDFDTDAPTPVPTQAPTDAPTYEPTYMPTDYATYTPTVPPTDAPTDAPTAASTEPAPSPAPTTPTPTTSAPTPGADLNPAVCGHVADSKVGVSTTCYSYSPNKAGATVQSTCTVNGEDYACFCSSHVDVPAGACTLTCDDIEHKSVGHNLFSNCKVNPTVCHYIGSCGKKHHHATDGKPQIYYSKSTCADITEDDEDTGEGKYRETCYCDARQLDYSIRGDGTTVCDMDCEGVYKGNYYMCKHP